MTRTPIPLQLQDISDAARQIAREIEGADTPPGHLSLMNILARAGGFRNFQHLRASAMAGVKLAQPPAQGADQTRVAQALRYFDEAGRFASWPSRTVLQHLCLWAVWAQVPRDAVLSETAFSRHLNGLHLFKDAAILRRTMWELRLISRSTDGRDYRRVEQAPPPEAVALIHALSPRWGK